MGHQVLGQLQAPVDQSNLRFAPIHFSVKCIRDLPSVRPRDIANDISRALPKWA